MRRQWSDFFLPSSIVVQTINILSLPPFEKSKLLIEPCGVFLSTQKMQLNKDDPSQVSYVYRINFYATLAQEIKEELLRVIWRQLVEGSTEAVIHADTPEQKNRGWSLKSSSLQHICTYVPVCAHACVCMWCKRKLFTNSVDFFIFSDFLSENISKCCCTKYHNLLVHKENQELRSSKTNTNILEHSQRDENTKCG